MALRTLDSLGSLAGKRVIVRCDLNVPLKDGGHRGRWPCAGIPPHAQRPHQPGRTRRRLLAPRAPRRRARPEVQPRTGRTATVGAARQAGRVRARHRGGVRPRGRRGPRGRRRRGDRESPVQPGRDGEGRRGARRVRRSSSRNSATRSSRTGSASCTASRRASTTSPRSCPPRPASSSRRRSRSSTASPRTRSGRTRSCSADRR